MNDTWASVFASSESALEAPAARLAGWVVRTIDRLGTATYMLYDLRGNLNPAQRGRVQEWTTWTRNTRGVTGARLNQAQLNSNGMQISRNQPDLQFTLSGGRSYVLPNGATFEVPHGQQRQVYTEFDPVRGGRSKQHLKNLLGDNPQGVVVLDVFDNNGLASTITFNPL